jgi:hypothetical protein
MNQTTQTLHISVANRQGALTTLFTIDSRGRIQYFKAPASPHAKSEPLAGSASPHDGQNPELVTP